MMNGMLHVALYFVAGAAGGLLASRLKLPGGAIIGSMIAVMGVKLAMSKQVELPQGFSFVVQILLGVLVGSMFRPEMVHQIKAVLLPIVISTLVLVGAGLAVTVALARLGLLDLTTAYLSTSPGAMSLLVGLASDASSQPLVVVTFHFFRVCFIILTAPLILHLLEWWLHKP